MRSGRHFLQFLLVFFLFGSAPGVWADAVILKDGSRLVGDITRIYDCKICLCTDFAGNLELPTSKVSSLEVQRSVNVKMKSGDVFVGSVAASSDGQSTTVHSAFGLTTIQADEVVALWDEGTPSPEEVAKRPKWKATVEGGITATEGNSDTMVGRAKFEAIRTTPNDLLKFYAGADYSEQNDRRNRNEYIAGVRYEHSISPRTWFWFARSEFEHDEFEDLDFRATFAGGMGYYWLREDRQELKTLAGPGYRYQKFNNGVTTDDVILDLGLDYRRELCDWLRFTHTTTYSPSVGDFADYRLTLDTALLMPLATSDIWKLKLGVRNDYNSRPLGSERLDNTYYANLLYELK